MWTLLIYTVVVGILFAYSILPAFFQTWTGFLLLIGIIVVGWLQARLMTWFEDKYVPEAQRLHFHNYEFVNYLDSVEERLSFGNKYRYGMWKKMRCTICGKTKIEKSATKA